MIGCWFAIVLSVLLGVRCQSCSCLGQDKLTSALGNKVLSNMGGVSCLPVKVASGRAACYPIDYGAFCKEWDSNLPTTCANAKGQELSGRPTFCGKPWCYVDTAEQGCARFFPSSYFVGLFYSYHSCGAENTYDAWKQKQGTSIGELRDVLLGYVKDTVKVATESLTRSMSSTCSPITGCKCVLCKSLPSPWDISSNIDLASTGYYLKDGSPAEKMAQCLPQSLHNSYERIIAEETADSRLGYMYFGAQGDGSMTQWPAADYCPIDTDFRFRPWYTSGATGPKDVVLVVDTSGSMRKNDRKDLAVAAAKAVIDTFVASDYATVVEFSFDATAQSTTLLPMHEEAKDAAKAWVEQHIGHAGGTNFKEGFKKVFEIMKESRKRSMASECATMILFLTDGDPQDWGANEEEEEENYAWLKTEAADVGGLMIHTYALGGEITENGKKKLKRIACDHRGIFNHLQDGDDLGAVMAGYYLYFATGTDSAKLRWREYTDAFNGDQLLTACLPAFDKSQTPRQLLGVSCIDMNSIADLADLKNVAGYADFKLDYENEQRTCAPFRLLSLDAQRLRYLNGKRRDAVCDADSAAPGTELFVCGDGVLDGDPRLQNVEECDDGNDKDGDGCSKECKVEPNWICPRLGYIVLVNNPSIGEFSGYLAHPNVYCKGTNLHSDVGESTAWPYCRQNLKADECAAWCRSNSDCRSFNYYEQSWGMTKGCCFRLKANSFEFLDGTSCYEQLPDESDSCTDTHGFIDEQLFTCHEWQGYDCESAVVSWGYTAEGQRRLLLNCRSSCAVCSGATCRPRCSQKVDDPKMCKDCVGEWRPWGACASDTVSQKPGGGVECIQSRTYKVTSVEEGDFAPCTNQDGEEEFRMIVIYTPGPWSDCLQEGGTSLACGNGEKRREAPCMADNNVCNLYSADFAPELKETCSSNNGCATIKTVASNSARTIPSPARIRCVSLFAMLLSQSLLVAHCST